MLGTIIIVFAGMFGRIPILGLLLSIDLENEVCSCILNEELNSSVIY